ncbi:cytochrome P450 [Aspergillus pseudodeflectus]|uniref:Cytochrome P450 n=1 Tax=Aspergillus pseudodeflectus TaxID=176178 RepID=A0ABR4JSF8_9EURO
MAMGNPGLWAHFSRSPRELRIPNDLEFPNSLLVVCGLPGLLLLFSVTVILFYPLRNKSDLPLINPGQGRIGILRGYRSRKTFAAELPRLVTEGLSKASAFRIAAPDGVNIVLAPRYAHEIAEHPDLNPGPIAGDEFNCHIDGFEVFAQLGTSDVIAESVRTRLTRQLTKLTPLLTTETSVLLQSQWKDAPTWVEVSPHETALFILSRLSSLVFVGDDLGHNPDWVHILTSYNTEAFAAAQELNLWPQILRPLVAHLKPSCRQLRRYIRDARALLVPVIEQRRHAQSQGDRREYNDAIEWLDETSRSAGQPYDPLLSQMLLAIGSFHTSSDLLGQVLLDLCGRRDWEVLVRELRKEIISSLQGAGWDKIALNNLKLMDSVLKESQRLKPASTVTMGRYASREITLSDGTTIPKGSTVFIANVAMRDPEIYPDPDAFIPDRFTTRREKGDSSAYLVAASPEHIGFGLGRHACPGRFFAANEVKIVLSHMLLKYDIKFPDNGAAAPSTSGIFLETNPDARICVRRRQEEIVI